MPEPVLQRWYRQPCPALAPFIDRFWGWQTSTTITLPMLLPGTGSECFFHVRSSPRLLSGLQLPEHYLVCPREQTTRYLPVSSCDFVAVRFRNGMFRHFSSIPFAALNDAVVPVQQLWGDDVEPCLKVFREAENMAARVDCIQQFLLSQLQLHIRHNERAIDVLIDRLYYAPNQRVEALADEAGWSCRHLERSFKNTLDLTPKRFARLARLHHTFRQMSLYPGQELLAVALERGFADQSHFIHDARALSGLLPRQLQLVLQDGSYYNPPSKQPE